MIQYLKLMIKHLIYYEKEDDILYHNSEYTYNILLLNHASIYIMKR